MISQNKADITNSKTHETSPMLEDEFGQKLQLEFQGSSKMIVDPKDCSDTEEEDVAALENKGVP